MPWHFLLLLPTPTLNTRSQVLPINTGSTKLNSERILCSSHCYWPTSIQPSTKNGREVMINGCDECACMYAALNSVTLNKVFSCPPGCQRGIGKPLHVLSTTNDALLLQDFWICTKKKNGGEPHHLQAFIKHDILQCEGTITKKRHTSQAPVTCLCLFFVIVPSRYNMLLSKHQLAQQQSCSLQSMSIIATISAETSPNPKSNFTVPAERQSPS